MSHRLFATAIFSLLPFAALAQSTPPAAPITVAAPAPVTAATSINPANAPVTRAEIPALVKQALMDDPDMVMQAVQKLRDKQAADAQKDAATALQKHHDELFNDAVSPSAGDAKTADVTIVEFFDYHCGYCKQLFPSMVKLLDEDKKVRILFREFPILAEDSVTASRAALAVSHIAPGKYFEFHSLLMKSSGKFDEKMLAEMAKKVGISGDKLKEAMKDKDITAQLDANRALADDLGIRGTPAVIVGDQLIPGALPYDDLHHMIDDVRSGKGTKPATPAKN